MVCGENFNRKIRKHIEQLLHSVLKKMAQKIIGQFASWINKNHVARRLINPSRFTHRDTGTYQIVRPGKVTDEQPVPAHIKKPTYYYHYEAPQTTDGNVDIKGEREIVKMRKSCQLAANILKSCSNIVQVGITTDEIDRFVHNETIKANAYPSPLRYAAFPKSVCTSVNNVVCHGIPDDRPLANGDIINIDVTVYYDGFHGDCSKTFLVGDVDEKGRHLVDVTEECLYKAISVCGPGVPFSKIGACIDDYADEKGLSVVAEFVGHGIGPFFHGPPAICHYRNAFPGIMKNGMTFTIEPILSLGSTGFKILKDEWTAATTDDSRTAQFEHTILITRKGCEVLTIADSDE